MPRSLTVVVSVTALSLLLGGCTTPPDTSITSSYGPELTQALLEIGPYPTPEPLSESDRQALLEEQIDNAWAELLLAYPSAERPDVEVIATVSGEEYRDARRDCLRDLGEIVGDDDDWEPDATEASALLGYTCDAQYPIAPGPPVTDDEIGYLYDFLITFTVPCLERLGMENPAPPSRSDFVSKWPQQHWWPKAEGVEMGSPEEIAVYDTCPSSPPAMQQARS